MKDKINNAFIRFYARMNDIMEDCVKEITEAVGEDLKEFELSILENVEKLKNEISNKHKVVSKEELRSECVTFLRDFGVKESYKGTEYLIYVLLNHRSSDVMNLSKLYEEISAEYLISSHTIRASFVSALKSVDEEYVTPKESLYTIMRDWETYKKDKELE
jgi:hypothetical protein